MKKYLLILGIILVLFSWIDNLSSDTNAAVIPAKPKIIKTQYRGQKDTTSTFVKINYKSVRDHFSHSLRSL